MDAQQFIKLLESVTERAPGTIELENTLEEIDWDSLCHLSLVAELQRTGQLQLDLSKLNSARTVSDLFETLLP